jgi:hypothetical protein
LVTRFHQREAEQVQPGPPAEHALISLLALNGLRMPEAAGADIEHMGLERGGTSSALLRG